MQTEIKRPIKKAGVGTPAETQNQLNESYWKDNHLSDLKTQLGEFLLFLQRFFAQNEKDGLKGYG